jgi:hypothetical protein
MLSPESNYDKNYGLGNVRGFSLKNQIISGLGRSFMLWIGMFLRVAWIHLRILDDKQRGQ